MWAREDWNLLTLHLGRRNGSHKWKCVWFARKQLAEATPPEVSNIEQRAFPITYTLRLFRP